MQDPGHCPVCKTMLSTSGSGGRSGRDAHYFNCPRCGEFGLTGTAGSLVPRWLGDDPEKIAVFSYTLRKMQMSSQWPLVDWEVAKQIITTGTLPKPQEQADNLLRWIGDNVPGTGESTSINPDKHSAIIGAKSSDGLVFIIQSLQGDDLVTGSVGMGGRAALTPTLKGWSRYEELKRGAASGWNAFMAMPFNKPNVDEMLPHIRQAVKETGFVLRRIDDDPKAGLIDDQLRVEIQAARFLIADLTYDNNGAYWEAGYAEGLGKPVIYTCERGHFDKHKTHFDTNHHLTVIWTLAEPEEAVKNLKATIRATIPEAAREDP